MFDVLNMKVTNAYWTTQTGYLIDGLIHERVEFTLTVIECLR